MNLKGKRLLFLSTLVSIMLIVLALFFEQKYLIRTRLLYVDSTSTSFLHSLIMLTGSLFLTTFFAFALETKYKLYIIYANYGLLLFVQVLGIIYGAYSIFHASKNYSKMWAQIGENKMLEAVENRLGCCGFLDVLSTVSNNCTFPQCCYHKLHKAKFHRRFRFLAFVSLSIIFQVFHIYQILSIEEDDEQVTRRSDMVKLNEPEI